MFSSLASIFPDAIIIQRVLQPFLETFFSPFRLPLPLQSLQFLPPHNYTILLKLTILLNQYLPNALQPISARLGHCREIRETANLTTD